MLIRKKIHTDHIALLRPFSGTIVVGQVAFIAKSQLNQYCNKQAYSNRNQEYRIRLPEQIRNIIVEPKIPYRVHPGTVYRFPVSTGSQRRTQKHIILYQLGQFLRSFPCPDIHPGKHNQNNQISHSRIPLPQILIHIQILVNKHIELVTGTDADVRFLGLGRAFRQPVRQLAHIIAYIASDIFIVVIG